MKWTSIAVGLVLAFYQQVIKVDVQLQQVTAIVRDGSGRFVSGLKAEDFILEEDGLRQDIAHFEEESVSPISLGIFVDTCWEQAFASAEAMLHEPPVPEISAILGLMGPRDEAALMGCSDRNRLGQNALKLYEDFTSDQRKLERHARENPGGGILDGSPRCCKVGMTRFEVITAALERMKMSHNRKRALVVIASRVDANASAEQRQDFLSQLARITSYEIPIYVFSELWKQPLDRTLPIIQLASETGGAFFGFFPRSAAPQIARDLEADIRGQYSIGYYLKSPASQSARVIRARTKSSDHKVTIRRRLN